MRLNSKQSLYESFMNNLNESASDRYQVRKFTDEDKIDKRLAGADYGVYDTKENKFIQKGSKKVMIAACDSLNKKKLNEKIEQKYEKSNRDYNKFMKDVKYYTGSYTYLFGGKVETECDGDPIIVNYFHYERPYGENTFKTVVNVLTPLGRNGEYIQEVIEKELQPSPTMLSQKEIKEKILNAVSSLN